MQLKSELLSHQFRRGRESNSLLFLHHGAVHCIYFSRCFLLVTEPAQIRTRNKTNNKLAINNASFSNRSWLCSHAIIPEIKRINSFNTKPVINMPIPYKILFLDSS